MSIQNQWWKTHRVYKGVIHKLQQPHQLLDPKSGSALTLTCNDGTMFQMADFMKVVMEQMKTTNKVLSKGEESETPKRLRLAEAEV